MNIRRYLQSSSNRPIERATNNNHRHPAVTQRSFKRRHLTSAVVAAGFTASLGFVAVGPASTAHAASLSCAARMVDATPTPGTRPVLRVTTAPGAAVAATVRFNTGTVTKSATASSTGVAKLYLPKTGLAGFRVRVDVNARKAGAGTACTTAFTPGGVPGARPSLPTGSRASIGPDGQPLGQVSQQSRYVDFLGGELDASFTCHQSTQTTQWYVAAPTTTSYWRSYQLWVYDYTTGNWQWGPWSGGFQRIDPFQGALDPARMSHPGWFGGAIQVAVYINGGWVYDQLRWVQPQLQGYSPNANAFDNGLLGCYSAWS